MRVEAGWLQWFLRTGPLTVILLAGCGESGKSHPSLSIERSHHDLGTMRTEDSREVTYVLKNSGSEALQIGNVDVSCGCLVPDVPQSIPPGDSGSLKITYKPDRFWQGRANEKVRFRTNDPLHPEVAVSFSADLQPPVRFKPGTVVEVPFVPGKESQMNLSVTPRAGGKIVAATSKSDRVQVSLSPGGVLLKVRPSKKAGDFEAEAIVSTTVEGATEIPIKVLGKAQEGPVSVPHAIVRNSLSGELNNYLLRKLAVQSRGRPIAVLGVQTDSPSLAAETRKLDERITEVAIYYRGGWSAGGPKSGFVEIKTDHPTLPLLRVPYRIGKIL